MPLISPISRASGAASRQRRRNIGFRKIVAFEQQRLAAVARQGVGNATAELQTRRMAAASAEIAVGFASDLSLLFIERLDDDARLTQQIIKAPADDRI
jgi:hypothetical protein